MRSWWRSYGGPVTDRAHMCTTEARSGRSTALYMIAVCIRDCLHCKLATMYVHAWSKLQKLDHDWHGHADQCDGTCVRAMQQLQQFWDAALPWS